MKVLTVRNVSEALPLGVYYLYQHGRVEDSRNGKVLASDLPVTTVYLAPQERVLFSPARNANPFFHLMEALWVMGGCQDVEWPSYFNKRFRDYSDDGKRIRGSAYGYRWQTWFGYNQLNLIIKELRRNPYSRRTVLAMWDASHEFSDLKAAMEGSKDVPCNTHAYFSLRSGSLELTVCNRSNDIWWGTYGANAVHFSILQEWVAAMLNRPVGRYFQISNNYHVYQDIVTVDKALEIYEEYTSNIGTPYGKDLIAMPLFAEEKTPALFPIECNAFCVDPELAPKSAYAFLRDTAYPMFKAWQARKELLDNGLTWAYKITAPDWRQACIEWINRKEANKKKENM